jgi:uncharacterized protein (TIGR00369 family)
MTLETEERGPGSAFIEAIGAEVEEWREGYVRMALRVDERHTNPNGVMHGGVATSLMDEATGAVIASVRGIDVMRQAPHATVEMSVSFLAGVWPGDDLVIEARAVRVGRTVAFSEVMARRRDEEKPVATGKFTYVIAGRGSP